MLNITFLQIEESEKTITLHQYPMPQTNCRPDGNLPTPLHQNRYYTPIVDGDFDFVSFIDMLIAMQTSSYQFYLTHEFN